MIEQSSLTGCRRLQKLLKPFRPSPPSAVQLTDAEEISRKYRYWQRRVLLSSIIGYATFYFVRKNLSIAMPFMETGLGIQKTQLGLFLTLHGLLYGVSKFANGFFAARANEPAVIAFRLGASALANRFLCFDSAVGALGVDCVVNGLVSGCGRSPHTRRGRRSLSA